MSADVVKAPRRTRGERRLRRAVLHRLRHTFGSNLAMRGGANARDSRARRPQNLATTQRHIHLSRVPLANAIRLPQPLWNAPEFWRHVGDGSKDPHTFHNDQDLQDCVDGNYSRR
jgi:hypothetical protein